MPRPAKFSERRILSAAARIVSQQGPAGATMASIGQAIGAPSGSLYHRFQTRDMLLGRLWLQKAAIFQNAFEASLAHADVMIAAREAALSLPRTVRADLEGARIMLLHRREDFLSGAWPREMASEAERLGAQVSRVLRDLTRRLFGDTSAAHRRTTTFAVVDVPFAAVRRPVAANEPPAAEIDEMIITALNAILAGARHG